MKYRALILLCFTCYSLNAQISLSSGSYPASVIGTDSLKVTTIASSFPSLPAMASGIWDMSVVTDSIPILFAYRVPTSATYQFADSNEYKFESFSYQGNLQSSILAGGIFEYAVSVQKSGYSISGITGSATDSLIITTQNMAYSSPRTVIAFPAAYHSSWASSYHNDLDFQLSYLMAGDTLAPGIMRTYTTEKDSVVGWGQMRVSDASGAPSQYFDVLQVQTVITHTDSFFLKGALFSSSILLYFNASQGQKDTVYQQNYYRAEEVTPLAQVQFHDAAYTQPYKATTHVQRLIKPVAVPGLVKDNQIKVYPNPVTNGSITIELPAPGSDWQYELTDITGRKITEGLLSAKGKIATIQLPPSTASGKYYLRVVGNDGQVKILPVEIATK